MGEGWHSPPSPSGPLGHVEHWSNGGLVADQVRRRIDTQLGVWGCESGPEHPLRTLRTHPSPQIANQSTTNTNTHYTFLSIIKICSSKINIVSPFSEYFILFIPIYWDKIVKKKKKINKLTLNLHNLKLETFLANFSDWSICFCQQIVLVRKLKYKNNNNFSENHKPY